MLGSSRPLDDSLGTRLHARLTLGRSRRTQHFEEKALAGDEVLESCEELIYLASSSVRYFDAVGVPCRSSDESYRIVMDAPPVVFSSQRAPSLFELVLQCAQRECDLEALPSGIPANVLAALNRAAKVAAAGNQECTTCKRSFIIPRAQWMEFWFLGPSTQAEISPESALPFLRTACSWSCAEPTVAGGFM